MSLRVHLHWDDPEQTIVRWEFDGWIGLLDYTIPINETASMGILNSGRADSILNLGLKLPFPNRHPRTLVQPVLAAHSYGLGYVVIVTRNPIAAAIIRATFRQAGRELGQAVHIVGSLAAARRRIRQLRSQPDQDIKMKMP
jgi:hypothetical protein